MKGAELSLIDLWNFKLDGRALIELIASLFFNKNKRNKEAWLASHVQCISIELTWELPSRPKRLLGFLEIIEINA